MLDIVSGQENGKKWIAGTLPMKHNITLEIDTRTGKGVIDVLNYLKDFVGYQASKIFLPAHSVEDTIQEIYTIAIIAIPEYDASKCANLLTFLQNHIRNRIINLYKFVTEQRRTAVWGYFRFFKIRCPACKKYFLADELSDDMFSCKTCGHTRQGEERWKKYPISIGVLSSNEMFELPDGSHTTIQDHFSYEDLGHLVGVEDKMSEDSVLSRSAIFSIIKNYDEFTQAVANMIIEGYNVSEIGRELDVSSAKVKARLNKLSKNKGLREIFLTHR